MTTAELMSFLRHEQGVRVGSVHWKKLDLFHSMEFLFPENISRVFLEYFHTTGNISIPWNWTKLWKWNFPIFFYNLFKIFPCYGRSLNFPVVKVAQRCVSQKVDNSLPPFIWIIFKNVIYMKLKLGLSMSWKGILNYLLLIFLLQLNEVTAPIFQLSGVTLEYCQRAVQTYEPVEENRKKEILGIDGKTFNF